MSVITRFAPSPTGYLHIGGARTALFNWLYARHHGGEYKLRIEDTDRARSTDAAIDAIISGLKWLGLDWDGEPVMQFSRSSRHAEVANEMLAKGKAYRCFTTAEELETLREKAKSEGGFFRFSSPWRDVPEAEKPEGKPFVVRLKAPKDGEVLIQDEVQGDVRFPADGLDDLVMLRSDGTPTYMLAVVVDDHDMGVTHIIRGDDHLSNAARQAVIYQAMEWDVPSFSHVPLIHGPDGAKLSKRHGALGVEAYRDIGFLPETMRNYLLRLGWAHGDDEIISTEQAIEWFETKGIGRSPSRLDFAKMENLNGHYIREADDARLVELVLPFLQPLIGRTVDDLGKARLLAGMNGLKQRAKTLLELADMSRLYVEFRPLQMDEKANKVLRDEGGFQIVRSLLPLFEGATEWKADPLQDIAKQYSESTDTKLGKVAQPLRAGLSGRTISPSVFEMMEVLGKEESLARLKDVC